MLYTGYSSCSLEANAVSLIQILQYFRDDKKKESDEKISLTKSFDISLIYFPL